MNNIDNHLEIAAGFYLYDNTNIHQQILLMEETDQKPYDKAWEPFERTPAYELLQHINTLAETLDKVYKKGLYDGKHNTNK